MPKTCSSCGTKFEEGKNCICETDGRIICKECCEQECPGRCICGNEQNEEIEEGLEDDLI